MRSVQMPCRGRLFRSAEKYSSGVSLEQVSFRSPVILLDAVQSGKVTKCRDAQRPDALPGAAFRAGQLTEGFSTHPNLPGEETGEVVSKADWDQTGRAWC